jgi:hypothetical protein
MGFGGFGGFFKSIVRVAKSALSNVFSPTSFLSGFNPLSFIASIALNMAVSVALSAFLGKKKQGQVASFEFEAQDRHVIARGGAECRRIIYGEIVSSGPLVFAASTGSNNKFLHLVVALANHECEEIGSIYLNDKEIVSSTLNGAGLVTTGTFANKVRIKKHLGTATQAADTDLVSEVTEWTSAHQLKSIAYIYVRLEFDTKLFPTGIPNVKATVKGKKILDPRDSGTRWSNNPALCIRDYLTDTDGLACSASEVDDTSINAAANICEEFVAITAVVDTFTAATTDICTRATASKKYYRGDRVQLTTTGTLPAGFSLSTNYFYIPFDGDAGVKFKLATSYANALAGTAIDVTNTGSGTHTITTNAQPKYTTDGSFKLDARPIEIVDDLVIGSAGAVVYSKGKYSVFVGKATASSKSIDEDVLMGDISVRPHIERSELFNTVRGTYSDPYNGWQRSDFPIISNATYVTEDGETLFRDIELPFTTDSTRAQRLAKILLEKSRQGITIEMGCNYSVMDIAVFDVISVTNTRLGFSSKEFRVMSWSFAATGGITMLLQEEASTVYDWSLGDETVIDSAPDTTLADPLDVDPPSIATNDSLVLFNAGTVIVKLAITLTAPATAFTEEYQVETKISTDSNFAVIGRGTELNFEQLGVISGSTYDVRAKTINTLGVESAYATTTHAVLGELAPPSDVTNFAINITGDQALLTWTTITDLDLEFYIIRFSTATSGADWNNSVDLVTQVARPATSVTVPALIGSYLIKARDKSGNESSNEAVIVSTIAGITGLNLITTQTESPTFAGAKSSTLLLDSTLQLSSNVLFESAGGNFDAATGFFDAGGTTSSVASTGTYDFASVIDLGSTFTSRLTAAITQSISDRHTLFDSTTGNFDSQAGNFDGSAPSNASSDLQISTTTDDPASGGASFSDFATFVVGDYTARGFKFRLTLNSLDNKVSPKVRALTVSVDLPDLLNSAADIVSGTGTKVVTFPTAFKTATPAIGVSGQGMSAGDGFSVSSKSATGFSINFFNSGGSGVSRTFDYIARGF